MFGKTQIGVGVVALAGLAAAGGAYAVMGGTTGQKHQLSAVGLGVVAVTPATHQAQVVVQCGANEGSALTVKLAPQVDAARITPGANVGVMLATPENLVVKVTQALPATCPQGVDESLQAPAAEQSSAPAVAPQPAATQVATTRTAAALPTGRAWTFFGKAKRNDLGALELDVDQVNMPLRYATTRYLLTDHDVRMLVVPSAPITDVAGNRISTLALDDATVRVQATLAKPASWRLDDEGRRVPTVIAKRIVVLQLDHQGD